MNPRFVELREQMLKLLKDIEDHANLPADKREADYNERGQKMLADLTAMEESVKTQQELDAAAQKRAGIETPAGERVSGKVADEKKEARETRRPLREQFAEFAKTPEFRRYAANPDGRSPVFDFDGSLYEERALIYGGALAADMVRPQLVPGIQVPREAIGTRAMRDVLLGGQTNSDSVTFVRENVFTNAAATVLEAVSTVTGAKPESSLTFTQATAPVEIIAHWIPITRNAVDDVPQLQSYVEGRLLDGLVREENDQLLNGDGTAPNISGILDQSGIQTLDGAYFTGAPVQNPGAGGPENFNRILRAKTLVMTTGDSLATFVAMNPTDWEVFLTLADQADNYFGMGPFDTATTPRIWNLDVVLTEDKAAGSSVVGDGTAAQVWDRMAARILVADQHSDFFTRNMLVLLAEERLGLTVYRPAAFALVTHV